MMLIVGGMDTEGEVFDDCLVCLLKDHGEDVDASAAASDDVLSPVAAQCKGQIGRKRSGRR